MARLDRSLAQDDALIRLHWYSCLCRMGKASVYPGGFSSSSAVFLSLVAGLYMRSVGKEYHSQIVRINEPPLAVLAVVLIMTIHLHMLFSSTLRAELLGASLTTVSFRPMVDSIHMLVARVLRTEGSRARLALPMSIVIHVVL